jgi:hypothetical protein
MKMRNSYVKVIVVQVVVLASLWVLERAFF